MLIARSMPILGAIALVTKYSRSPPAGQTAGACRICVRSPSCCPESSSTGKPDSTLCGYSLSAPEYGAHTAHFQRMLNVKTRRNGPLVFHDIWGEGLLLRDNPAYPGWYTSSEWLKEDSLSGSSLLELWGSSQNLQK